jgi:uncharacterized surface protein with fasciclin (FAS1) repeats
MRLIRASACRLIAFGLAALITTTTAPALAAPASLLDVASGRKNLTMFVSAVKMAGLADTLSGPGEYTVFAPTDECFSKMSQDQHDAMMRDPAKLKAWLQHFIIVGRVTVHSPDGDLAGGSFPTLGGSNLVAKTDANNDLTVGGARVVTADIAASNGLLDAIDHVPMP